jgi:hypothetical protein
MMPCVREGRRILVLWNEVFAVGFSNFEYKILGSAYVSQIPDWRAWTDQ